MRNSTRKVAGGVCVFVCWGAAGGGGDKRKKERRQEATYRIETKRERERERDQERCAHLKSVGRHLWVATRKVERRGGYARLRRLVSRGGVVRCI